MIGDRGLDTRERETVPLIDEPESKLVAFDKSVSSSRCLSRRFCSASSTSLSSSVNSPSATLRARSASLAAIAAFNVPFLLGGAIEVVGGGP